jgi:alkyl hydroperoxide reductase subunit D
MSALEALRQSLPDAARDTKLNLEAVVMRPGLLTPAQRWGVAVACGYAVRHPALAAALVAEASGQVEPSVIDDAKAAATLMAMNNVFYRFRHMVGKESYGHKPARLRMNRLAQPLGPKVDFELVSLAVSALNGCESCIKAHEKVVLENGLTEDHVFEAVRIASVIHAAAVGLELTAPSSGSISAA